MAEASPPASAPAEAFPPHVRAAVVIPVAAVQNSRSSISEPHPGICSHFPPPVFPVQLSRAKARLVSVMLLWHRRDALPFSVTAWLKISCQPALSIHGGTSHVVV